MKEITEIFELPPLPLRPKNAHKGSCGRLLVIAGSHNMAGAAYLAGLAAYRMGCGLVNLCTPDENRVILQTLLPEAILSPLEDAPGLLPDYDAVLLGPGFGRSDAALDVLTAVLRDCTVPLLLDADGLNLIAAHKLSLRECTAPIVITPHAGEMARLTGKTIAEILADPIEICHTFAAENRLICLLKDAETVVSDGNQIFRNHSGTPALATAGSGDTLAGILGALLSDGMEPLKAAYTAAFLHGKCGEEAEKRLGERPVMARDISSAISTVLLKLQNKEMKNMNLTIRTMRPTDAADYLTFLRQVGSESDNLAFGKEGISATPDQYAKVIERVNNEGKNLLLVALDGNEIVGYGGIYRESTPRFAHRAELAVFVRKDHWNRGIGKALMKEMLDYSQNAGIKVVQLQVRADNGIAIHLYKSCGFTYMGTCRNYFQIGDASFDAQYWNYYFD